MEAQDFRTSRGSRANIQCTKSLSALAVAVTRMWTWLILSIFHGLGVTGVATVAQEPVWEFSCHERTSISVHLSLAALRHPTSVLAVASLLCWLHSDALLLQSSSLAVHAAISV
mmetsp:Transcript_46683/g.92904  ORF Transcript_46683/g.92904 Transcript_46683/m.92904 type:complete len:114 (-) Transcript_46683:2539-2880(-)